MPVPNGTFCWYFTLSVITFFVIGHALLLFFMLKGVRIFLSPGPHQMLRGVFLAKTHPPSTFHQNSLISFCVILLTMSSSVLSKEEGRTAIFVLLLLLKFSHISMEIIYYRFHSKIQGIQINILL